MRWRDRLWISRRNYPGVAESPYVALIPLPGIPEVHEGADLATVIVAALAEQHTRLLDGDILVVTSKVVSKAAGLWADPGRRAELVLEQSTSVVAERRTGQGHTRVVAAVSGPVLAGAGIDASNSADERLLLLPEDPDQAAVDLHARLAQLLPDATRIAVLLTDTAGRPWRAGLVDLALGCSGLNGLDDLRGASDTHGRDLAVTVRNLADEIAAAADLVKGKLDRVPVAIVRGLAHLVTDGHAGTPARELVRSGPTDWFAMGRAEAVRDALGVPAGSALSERVGIESVAPESLLDRVDRAVRVALLGLPEVCGARGIDVEITPSGDQITLVAPDALTLGRVWARTDVALAGERLRSAAADASCRGSVTLEVSERW